MKIHVSKIPEEGLEIVEQLDPHAISLDSEGITFIEPIKIKAKAIKSGKEVFIDISLEGKVEYACAKCLARFETIFKKEFEFSREVNSGDVLEIDEDIRQEIILDYPMKVVCKPGCKGLCPNCGSNLNVMQCDCSKDSFTEHRGLDL